MMKKLTALSLALVLLLSVCAGCGSKPASSAGSAGSEAGSDTSAPAHGEILIKLGASSSQTEPTGIAGQKFADLVNEKLAGKAGAHTGHTAFACHLESLILRIDCIHRGELRCHRIP